MSRLDHHNILSDKQHGFRKRRSCESQLIVTIDDLARCLNESGQIDAILLNLYKAFDKAPNTRLAKKLNHYCVRGETLTWINSFLANLNQQVVLEGKQSSTAPVISGVSHGTVLGPLLFLCYIIDLPECVSSTARLFADDYLLYRVINSHSDTDLLQWDLQDWEDKWLMQFNPDKCEGKEEANSVLFHPQLCAPRGQSCKVPGSHHR